MEVPAGRPTHGSKNADERAPFKGKRPGHNSNGNRQLFKEGTSERPQRTLNWKLGVEARFETGLTGVPSFSSSFSGAETMVGGEIFGIINYPDSKYAAETGIGCRCHPYGPALEKVVKWTRASSPGSFLPVEPCLPPERAWV